MVFVRHRTKNQGLTHADAVAYADTLHDQTTMWIGCRVKMHCIPRTLKDTRNDLHMAREFTTRQTEERIRDQKGAACWEIEQHRMADSHASPSSQGLTWRADCYVAAQFLCNQERAIGRKSGTPECWGVVPESGAECYDVDETRHWSLFPGIPGMPGRQPQGHPLGGG